MRSGIGKYPAAGALLACLAATAHAFDWQDIRKQVEKFRDKPAQSGKSQPRPVLDAGLEAARALTGLSLEEEVAIGHQSAGNLLGAAPLVANPGLQKYVNEVGRWIASNSTRPGLDWRFGVIASNDINAFAAPGGYVFVTRGLYRLLRNESELAGVLAHEIAHVVEKHQLKILEQSRLLERGGRRLSGGAGEDERIKNLIGNGAEIFSRSLDRKAEFEADRMAMVLAARAGYDPFGLPAVLQDLGRIAKDSRRVSLLFKTHPHPEERLAELEATGERLEAIEGKVNSARFFRIKPQTAPN